MPEECIEQDQNKVKQYVDFLPPNLNLFCKYLTKNYIGSTIRKNFENIFLCCHSGLLCNIRTINSVEAWHRILNVKSNTTHQNLAPN